MLFQKKSPTICHSDPQCCTPKFSLPYSSKLDKNHLHMVQNCSRVAQSNHLLSQSKLGFWFLQRIWGFQWLNQVSCAHIHCQASTCQVSSLTASGCTVKSPIWFTINCRGKWSFAVKSQNFWSTSYFEHTIIIWSSLDHDSTRMAQKSSRCQKFLFWDSWKVNCNLTKA